MEKIDLVVTVRNCARCGKDHNDLEFSKFSENPIWDSDHTIWNYWGVCPTYNEPILLKIVEEDNGKN